MRGPDTLHSCAHSVFCLPSAASRGQRFFRDAVRAGSAAASDQAGQPGHASSVRRVFDSSRSRPGAELRRRTPEGARLHLLLGGIVAAGAALGCRSFSPPVPARSLVCAWPLTRASLCRRCLYESAHRKLRLRMLILIMVPLDIPPRFTGAVIVPVSI